MGFYCLYRSPAWDFTVCVAKLGIVLYCTIILPRAKFSSLPYIPSRRARPCVHACVMFFSFSIIAGVGFQVHYGLWEREDKRRAAYFPSRDGDDVCIYIYVSIDLISSPLLNAILAKPGFYAKPGFQ